MECCSRPSSSSTFCPLRCLHLHETPGLQLRVHPEGLPVTVPRHTSPQTFTMPQVFAFPLDFPLLDPFGSPSFLNVLESPPILRALPERYCNGTLGSKRRQKKNRRQRCRCGLGGLFWACSLAQSSGIFIHAGSCCLSTSSLLFQICLHVSTRHGQTTAESLWLMMPQV